MRTALLLIAIFCVFVIACSGIRQASDEKYYVLSREVLLDKIKGAWAVQTIGVTYGDPTEFVFQQRTIPDSVEIEADFAGIMSSGMPNTAAETCDRVGHILVLCFDQTHEGT